MESPAPVRRQDPVLGAARPVLAVGLGTDEFQRVAPFLERCAFDVDRFPGALNALRLLAAVPFELLLVRFPLRDINFDVFLGALRELGSASRTSPVVLIAEPSHLARAKGYIGIGVDAVVSLALAEESIRETLATLLRVTPRRAPRIPALLEVTLSGVAGSVFFCHTRNVSETGMLVQTGQDCRKGAALSFELWSQLGPIRGVSRVVRNTDPQREGIAGVGLEHVSLVRDSLQRYRHVLSSLQPSHPATP